MPLELRRDAAEGWRDEMTHSLIVLVKFGGRDTHHRGRRLPCPRARTPAKCATERHTVVFL
jgi:hypothetical protein